MLGLPWVVLVLVGCAAQRAQGPLEVPLGLTAGETARAVRAYDFCRRGDADADGDGRREIFPQCGRPGVVYGDAWVVLSANNPSAALAVALAAKAQNLQVRVAVWNQNTQCVVYDLRTCTDAAACALPPAP